MKALCKPLKSQFLYIRCKCYYYKFRKLSNSCWSKKKNPVILMSVSHVKI